MGGVLIDLDFEGMMRQFSRIATPAMRSLSEAELNGIGGDSAWHLYELGEISTDEYLESMCQQCIAGTTKEEVKAATFAALKTIPQARLDKILEMRKRGYRTYVLSNINDMHWDYIDELMGGWQTYFDDVFLSQRLHLCKPDARIYQALMESTGLQPDEILYFDDRAENVAGGREAGWLSEVVLGDEWFPIVEKLLSGDEAE